MCVCVSPLCKRCHSGFASLSLSLSKCVCLYMYQNTHYTHQMRTFLDIWGHFRWLFEGSDLFWVEVDLGLGSGLGFEKGSGVCFLSVEAD